MTDKMYIDIGHKDLLKLIDEVLLCVPRSKDKDSREYLCGVRLQLESVAGRKTKRLVATATNGRGLAQAYIDEPRGAGWEVLPDNYIIYDRSIKVLRTLSQNFDFACLLRDEGLGCFGSGLDLCLPLLRSDFEFNEKVPDIIKGAMENPVSIELTEAATANLAALIEAQAKQVIATGKERFGSYFRKDNVCVEFVLSGDSFGFTAKTKHGISDDNIISSVWQECEFVYDEAKATDITFAMRLDEFVSIAKRINGAMLLKVSRDDKTYTPTLIRDSADNKKFYLLVKALV